MSNRIGRFVEFEKKIGWSHVISLVTLLVAPMISYFLFSPQVNLLKSMKPLLVDVSEVQFEKTHVYSIKIRNESPVPARDVTLMIITDAYSSQAVPQPAVVTYPPAPFSYHSDKNVGTIKINRPLGPREELVVVLPGIRIEENWFNIIDASVFSEVGSAIQKNTVSGLVQETRRAEQSAALEKLRSEVEFIKAQKQVTAKCGNGKCEFGEDSLTCLSDCPRKGYCGDGSCNGGENIQNCGADCGR